MEGIKYGFEKCSVAVSRMMEWVIRDVGCATAYIDDVLIGSKGATLEECIAFHRRDVFRVLEAIEE